MARRKKQAEGLGDTVEQVLEVTSAIRKVIKSDKFKSIYNISIYFSLQFKFG